MKWSWKVGTVAGIGLYVHATFLLLIAWVGITYWLAGGSAAALDGIAFILALFACVVLHELGHALTARRFGIRTRDITLLPIGGVSRLERIPDNPRQEVWVSFAGPAVNVVIAAVLYAGLLLSHTMRPFATLGMTAGTFVERLLVLNISLAVFNLLPAFPMDGGRVLRALLAMRMDYVRATQVAAHVGQAMALVFGLLGLFTNPFLVFIALFVWIGAAQEASMVQMRAALSGIPVSRAMVTNFHTVAPDDPAKRVLELILAGSQQDFPVVEEAKGSRLAGVLLRSDVLKALARGSDWHVRDLMRREFEVVDAADMLDTALARLQSCACHALPVTSRGALVGILTMDNVGEFLLIQSAQGRAPRPRTA
ncbi:MAG TPA: site-2 protease family protein [Gemmatimonadales bacterium]|nr:site-2 protease family protein [Gemmatimonadales bacterium]